MVNTTLLVREMLHSFYRVHKKSFVFQKELLFFDDFCYNESLEDFFSIFFQSPNYLLRTDIYPRVN